MVRWDDVTSKPWRLTKQRLYRRVADQIGVSPKVARAFFDELPRLAELELKMRGEFQIPGVVKLVVDQRPARTCVHPWKRIPIEVPSRMSLKARLVRRLKEKVMGRPGRG